VIMSAQSSACPGWTRTLVAELGCRLLQLSLRDRVDAQATHNSKGRARVRGLQRATDLLASAFAGRNFATDAGTILTVSPSKAARMRGTAEGPRHAIAAREGIGMRATTRDHALHVGMATFLVIVAS